MIDPLLFWTKTVASTPDVLLLGLVIVLSDAEVGLQPDVAFSAGKERGSHN